MLTIRTALAGVSFRNHDGSERQDILEAVEVGQRIELRRDPRNRHDPHAIEVLGLDGRMLGFIPAPIARSLAPELDRGSWATGRVHACYGGGDRWRGCQIEIRVAQRGPEEGGWLG